jgi:hypothetical protein
MGSKTLEPHLHFLGRLQGLGECMPDPSCCFVGCAGAGAQQGGAACQPAGALQCFQRQAGAA